MSSREEQLARYCTCLAPDPEPFPSEWETTDMFCKVCGGEI